MSAKTYTVAGPSELHLGPDAIYLPGEPVELTKETAAPLLADGVVIAGAKRPEGDALQAAIRAAIEALDPANPECWTKGGKPDVRALEKVLGFDITAPERDAAWAAVEAARTAAATAEAEAARTAAATAEAERTAATRPAAD